MSVGVAVVSELAVDDAAAAEADEVLSAARTAVARAARTTGASMT